MSLDTVCRYIHLSRGAMEPVTSSSVCSNYEQYVIVKQIFVFLYLNLKSYYHTLKNNEFCGECLLRLVTSYISLQNRLKIQKVTITIPITLPKNPYYFYFISVIINEISISFRIHCIQ